MNYVKRTIAGILAAAIGFSAVGCGKEMEKEKAAQDAVKVSEVIKNLYSAVEVGEMTLTDYVDQIFALGDTGKYLVTGYGDAGYSCCVTDSEFTDYQILDLSYLQDEHEAYNAYPVVMPGGRIFLAVKFTDYEDGTVLPDYEDPDFDWGNFDFDALADAATDTYFLYEIDETGEVISENQVKGIEEYIEKGEDNRGGSSGGSGYYALGDDTVIFTVSGMNDDNYIAVGTDGSVIGKLDLGDGMYLHGACGNDRDGDLLFTNYDDGEVIVRFDAETMTVSDTISMKGVDSYFSGIYRGNDEYPALIAGRSALYGLTADNGIEEILNWGDADLSGDSVRCVFPVDNGEFILYINDWQSDVNGFYRLTKRDPSEIDNAVVINLVTIYDDADLNNMVKKFNQENPDYRIRVEVYDKYYEFDDQTDTWTNTPEKQLQRDIATGKSVDMIYMGDAATIHDLGKKGALVDLYEYMGKDGSPAKEDFVDSVLSGMEIDGKLYAMPLSFSIKTYAAKTKYFSENNCTLDELIEVYDSLPEDCKLYDYSDSKQMVFNDLAISGCAFTDYENGTCSFDSPEFIKILEFADRFPNEDEVIDWDYEEMQLAYRNDKALLYNLWLSSPRMYKEAKDGVFGEDITLVGMPSADGAGARLYVGDSIFIMSTSPSKDVCWEFVTRLLTDNDEANRFDLPVLKSDFEKKLDETMERPYWFDEDGNKLEYDQQYYLAGEILTIEPFTQEERDYIADYILNAKYSEYYYDEEIFSIVNEEVGAFFAGEKSAQDAADLIQDRVSILISEKS